MKTAAKLLLAVVAILVLAGVISGGIDDLMSRLAHSPCERFARLYCTEDAGEQCVDAAIAVMGHHRPGVA